MPMSQRISELQPGSRFDSFFVVTEVRESTTRTGNRYLTVNVKDATGSAVGRIWSPGDTCPDGLDAPGIYRLTGKIDTFREEIQLAIEVAVPYQPSPDEYDQLLAASRWTPEVLEREVRGHLDARLRSDAMRRLLNAVLQDPDVVARYWIAPAATGNHHAYRSGLAEHTLSMLRLASSIADHYAAYYPGRVDEDILIGGILLHDLGKIWELEGDLAPTYSTVGRLVGHIPMGAIFIERVAHALGGIPDVLVWELQHLVLSHHGQLDFGSPKRPKTVEAQILHLIDNIDAKTNTIVHMAEDEGWTSYIRAFERPMLNPQAMRESWTTPPPGALHDRGPGNPVSDRTSTPQGSGTSTPPAGTPPEQSSEASSRAMGAPPDGGATAPDVSAASTRAQAADTLSATLGDDNTPPNAAEARGVEETAPPTEDSGLEPSSETGEASPNLNLFDGL